VAAELEVITEEPGLRVLQIQVAEVVAVERITVQVLRVDQE
jgi:hypothetical protein